MRSFVLSLLAASLLQAQNPPPLTRQDAERIALANNPRIHVSQLLGKVQGQSVRETRAGELPSLTGNLTGVEANEGSRIGSGTLTASRLLTHAGTGVQFAQLITDFGRTRNLVASEKLKEKARQADVVASQQEITLAADQAFYEALEAQSTLQIADQTVATRHTLVDKVNALTNAKLKSTLDLSFAKVDLARAKLLQLDARNRIDSAMAVLASVLGFDHPVSYRLIEDSAQLPDLPPDAAPLIDMALRQRPDLESLQFIEQSAKKFSTAQHDQLLPSINAIATVGATPFGGAEYFSPDWYGAAGVNISIPIFDGFRFRAQAAEAKLQVNVASEQIRQRRDQIAQDVRTAWLNANTALERVNVAAELLKEASMATDLAQSRYSLGLSSIVELSQAQLQQTEAAIGDANARTDFRLAMAALAFQSGGSIQP
jgi:outer membrane protein